MAQETLEIRDYVVAARLFTFVHNMNQNLKSLKFKKADSLKSILEKTRLIA
jgi:hypothetical protein